MNTLSILILILALIILLPKVKFAQRHTYFEHPYPLEITKAMQGFFAFLISFHQIAVYAPTIRPYLNSLDIFSPIGVLLVGFFFFFSGYGLITSCEEKKDYLKTFLIRRVFAVLIPFFLCNYAYMVTTLLCGNRFTTKDLVLAFFGLILLNDNMWFAVEIMILYLIFYLVYTHVQSPKARLSCMGSLVLLMIFISFLLGHKRADIQINWFHGEWWYNTTLLFFLGMLFASHKKNLVRFAKKYYWALVAVFIPAFLLFWKLTDYMLKHHGYWTETLTQMGYRDKFLTLSVQLPAVICFEALLLLLFLKVHFNNKMMAFLGKISLEIILIEKVFITTFEKMGLLKNYPIYIFLTVTATIIASALINLLKSIIIEKK